MNWMPHASDTKIVWNALEWITVKPVWVNSTNTWWESPKTEKPFAETMKDHANVHSVNVMPCLLENTLLPVTFTLTTTTCSTQRLAGTQKRNASPAVDQLIQNAVVHQLDHTFFSMEITQTKNAAQMAQLRLIVAETTPTTTTVTNSTQNFHDSCHMSHINESICIYIQPTHWVTWWLMRRWTPVQTILYRHMSTSGVQHGPGLWQNYIFNHVIKNALTVSFFKAVYIIKWRPSPWCCHDAYANDKRFILYHVIGWTAVQTHVCTLMNGLGSDYLLSLLFQDSDDFFDAETSLTSGGARTRKNFEIKKNNLKNVLFSMQKFCSRYCSR